jgi:hypothetical protein
MKLTARNEDARKKSPSWLLSACAWLMLSVASPQPMAWAQSQETALPDRSAQVPQGAKNSSQAQSERIFGIVPAYSITDARNAPPLTSKEKFKLFVSGTLDPFPFAVYAVQAGVEQANDSHSGYGQGAAGYARRFGAALGDGRRHDSSRRTRSRRFFTRILAISAKVKEAPGLASAIRYLADS